MKSRKRVAVPAVLAAGAVIAIAAVALLLVAVARSGSAPDASPRPPVERADPEADEALASEPAQPADPQDVLFSPSSFWNRPLEADAPLDPSSEEMVADLVEEVAREQEEGIGPWIQTTSYSTPIYRVPADQPTVRVALDDPDLEFRQSLQAAFEEVPIPPDAAPAPGSDGHMTVWQPSKDRLWEFYRARREADGWHASWGGAIRDVSKSPGYYRSDSWPGASHNWGATASSLPVAGGVMGIEELEAGVIDHALAVNLPFPRAEEYSWPAQRTDGTGPPDAIPEGGRLRLDPELDLDGLDLHPVARAMAEAVQEHGMVVRDRTMHAIGFAAEDPAPTGGNPYRNASGGLFEGQIPTEFLADFPWEHLEVLELSLCDRPYAPCSR